MANTLDKKLVRILSDEINDYGVAKGSTLNVGVNSTADSAKNKRRAVEILAQNSDLSGLTHAQVVPDSVNPKTSKIRFSDAQVQADYDAGLISIPPEKTASLSARFAEGKEQPFSVALKPSNTSGRDIPMMSGPEIESTLASKIEDPQSWILPPRVEAYFNRPSKQYDFIDKDGNVLSVPSSVNQTLKNVVGSLVSEGYSKKLTDNTTGRLGDAFGGTRGDIVRGTGNVLRKAAPIVGTGISIFGGDGGIKDENKKKAEVAKAAAENVGVELDFKAIQQNFKDSDTNDPNFFLNAGTIAGVPDNLQDSVWDKVRTSVDGNKRTASLYRLPAAEVMKKFETAYEQEFKTLRGKVSTGRVDKSNNPVEDKIPTTREWADSNEPRIISTPFVFGDAEKNAGILAKDGKRYQGVIVDIGLKGVSEYSKKKEDAKKTADAADPKKSDVTKGPKTLESLMKEEEESPSSGTERYKWAFFVQDKDKKGMKALYLKDGKLATPEF